MTKKIVISSGEPAGIGPDLCISLAAEKKTTINNANLYIIADPDLLTERADILNIDIHLQIHDDIKTLSSSFDDNKLNVIPLQLKAHCTPGVLNKDNSAYVLQMLDLGCDLCLQKNVDALVTGPVQKSIINAAGYNFTGHTEYLADRASSTHTIKPVMMLATKKLRVALATTHLPLKDVSKAITKESLSETLIILNEFLKQQVGLKTPQILICGLNPHAGEDGNLGYEEINIITPVVEQLKKQGMNLIGPLPADTLYTHKYLEHADATLAMYHDQGLPVLKFSGFGEAVNVTLGLPFVRTSVDHGTALDLAATGRANNGSLIAAINMAVDLSNDN
ncbi:MAG: 4-hydroxythreonine-4-phosphate dehydrogenase PdxA [Gammaproteobacteria bacterium]|nr:MAG: 4-hydroxythreonine-4-phosphate dehydrogenase PdxA [Gammaproteobacteria bacterium]